MRITTVDTHTEGQATRIVVSGMPEVAGETMSDRRRDFRRRYDHLRRGLLAEPRGHAGMTGCVIVDPCDPSADFGAIFMHNDGYADVSGQGAIGVVTALFESGILEAEEDASVSVALDTVAGVVRCEATAEEGRVGDVRFHNVPAWVGLQAASVQVPEHGEIVVDVAYGGNLYVTAWAEHLGVALLPENMAAVTEAATAVLRAARDKLIIRNPMNGDRCRISAAAVLDAPHEEPPALRGVEVFGPGLFDRSPGAASAAARLAATFARGDILAGQEVVVESAITAGKFRAVILEQERAGTRSAVSTVVTGRAWVTGIHDFVFDAEDPFRGGFLVGDE